MDTTSQKLLKQMAEKKLTVMNMDMEDEIHTASLREAFGDYMEMDAGYAASGAIPLQAPDTYMTLLQYKEDGKDLVDTVIPSKAVYNETKKTLSLFYICSFVEQPRRVCYSITLPGYGCAINWEDDAHTYISGCKAMRVDLSRADRTQEKVLFQCIWETGNPLRKKAQSFTIPISEETDIKELRLTKPVRKAESTSDKLVVMYQRTAQISEFYDYNYPEAIHDDIQEMILEVEGSADIGPDMTALKVLDYTLSAITNHGSTAYHNNDYQIKIDEENSQLLTFHFNQDWCWTVPTWKLDKNDIVTFNLWITLLVYNSQKKQNEIFTLKMASDLESVWPEGPVVQKSNMRVPYMLLLWGCLAAGSRILMADGRYKMIEEIRIGDQVQTGSGAATMVTNCFSGLEDGKIIEVVTLNDTLRLTKQHPVLTVSGWKEASAVTAADILNGKNGPVKVEDVRRIPYQNMVYNLDLESAEHSMICNGIIVGDQIKQNGR